MFNEYEASREDILGWLWAWNFRLMFPDSACYRCGLFVQLQVLDSDDLQYIKNAIFRLYVRMLVVRGRKLPEHPTRAMLAQPCDSSMSPVSECSTATGDSCRDVQLAQDVSA